MRINVPDATVRAAAGTDEVAADVAALDAAVAAQGARVASLEARVGALEVTPPPPVPDPVPEPEPPDPVPAPGGLVFESKFEGDDWTDNGKWGYAAGIIDRLEIFDTSVDPDVPGGRGLRTINRTPTDGHDFWDVIRAVGVPVPQVGESIRWRWAYKLVRGDGDGDYHPIDWGTGLLNSSPTFAVLKFVFFNGAWQPQFQMGGIPGQWYATADAIIAPNEWYWYDVTFHRQAGSSWAVDYQIEDLAGNVVVAPSDMIDNFGSNPSRRLNAVTANNGNAAHSALMEIGSPGIGGVVGATHEGERYAHVRASIGVAR